MDSILPCRPRQVCGRIRQATPPFDFAEGRPCAGERERRRSIDGQVANASALSLSIAVRFGACTLKVIIHLLKRERLPGDRSACRGDPVPQRCVSVSVEATGSRCSGVSHTPLA